MGKVDFVTKYLSNKNYLREISVENKTTLKFFFQIGWYEHYAAQIIRAGNCITLLSTTINLNRDNFWNIHYFEEITRYLFWTFNKSFLLVLTEKIETLSPATLNRCIELLNTYFVPYDFSINDSMNDQEIIWCKVKNEHLKADAKFINMYNLDKENRTILLEALIKRRDVLLNLANEKKESLTENTLNGTVSIAFMDMLRPMNGSTAAAFQFIRDQTEKANIEFNIFLPVAQLENGKNPYGLNGCIAAVIDYYYQRNFFKKEYSLEQIFKAYAVFSGNSIGKLKPFLSTFRQDKNYLKYFSILQSLKTNKLP